MAEALTIRHTSAGGTLIEGTARGDGSAEVLRAAGWKWGRSISCWYLPHSRDRAPRLLDIERAAAQLRAAGFAVAVDVDATPRPQVQAEAERAERMDERAAALHGKAERLEAEATARYAAAREIGERMQGEPIHVGHHSERRHRADIRRHDQHINGMLQASGDATRIERRAQAAERHMSRREDPLTVARRIERLDAQLRDVRRKLDGTSRNGMLYGERADGAYRTQLQVEAIHLADQVAHWRQVHAEQVAAGAVREWSAADFQPGDRVRVRGAWRRVVRVNRTTISVETGYSWTDRVPFREVADHQRPDEQPAQVEAPAPAPAPAPDPDPEPPPAPAAVEAEAEAERDQPLGQLALSLVVEAAR
jgi:Domain of unknown function (DUF3560)